MPINTMNPCVHQLGRACSRCGYVGVPARFYGPEGLWSHEKATAAYKAWKDAGRPSVFDGERNAVTEEAVTPVTVEEKKRYGSNAERQAAYRERKKDD